MVDTSPKDSGDGFVTPPASQPAAFSVENLLAEMTLNEASAASLTKSLKDRGLRDFLKGHGIKIQAADDVGYNSLPLELRDRIREIAIADTHAKDMYHAMCRHCPRLAPYSCIDSEWRDAVETVTFRRLIITGSKEKLYEDLELLRRYVVGNRQKFVQQIRLQFYDRRPTGLRDVECSPSYEPSLVDVLTSPIGRLFEIIAPWQNCNKGEGDLSVEIDTIGFLLRHGYQDLQLPAYMQRVGVALASLPTVPQIVHFQISLSQHFRITSLQTMLSHMPHIRSLSVKLALLTLNEDIQDSSPQTQSFYNALSQSAPHLEALEVHGDGLRTRNERHGLQNTFFAASFTFSQKLRSLSFDKYTLGTIRAVFAPFSMGSYDSNAPPPLVWPNLTDLKFGECRIDDQETRVSMVLNDLMLAIGRAVKNMPRIQHLEMVVNYHKPPEDGVIMLGFADLRTEIVLKLESLRDSHEHAPVATLRVAHQDSSHLPELVPSQNVVELWEKSMSHAANATLEVEVAPLPPHDLLSRDIWGF